MTAEELYSFALVQIGVVLFLSTFRIRPVWPRPGALFALQTVLLADAGSWLIYSYSNDGWYNFAAALLAALNAWGLLGFALLRCERKVPWRLFALAIPLQAVGYSWFDLFLAHGEIWHWLTFTTTLTIGPTIWLFWQVKQPKTVSDLWFCVSLAVWLGFCWLRSLLQWFEPSWLTSSNIFSQALWPAVMTAYGLFAIASYMEESQQKLQWDAELDSLTGVLNRRGFESWLKRRRQRVQRGCLLLLDLDHFKRINDQFGHAQGDLMLVQLTTVLRAALRPDDLLGRFGGEEFMMFLPELDIVQAQQIAERLLSSTRTIQLPDQQQHLSISIGLTDMPMHEPVELTLRRADQALYLAKQQGRDRVEIARIHEEVAAL